jgi:hypothetical protein
VNQIADVICLRAEKNKNFGTVLIPEGLLPHLSLFKLMIDELNEFFKTNESEAEKLLDPEFANKVLSPWAAARFVSLPDFIQNQLVLEREVNGVFFPFFSDKFSIGRSTLPNRDRAFAGAHGRKRAKTSQIAKSIQRNFLANLPLLRLPGAFLHAFDLRLPTGLDLRLHSRGPDRGRPDRLRHDRPRTH